MATTPSKTPQPVTTPAHLNTEYARWMALVGSAPKKTNNSLIKGSKFAASDLISVLRNTAHAVKTRHPRSSGKMFSDIAQSSGNGEPVVEGRGASPVQVGIDNVWSYPGGAPPGYPTPGPKDTMVVMESGNLWSSDGRQPWTDPGYPTMQDPDADPPDDEDEDPDGDDTENPTP